MYCLHWRSINTPITVHFGLHTIFALSIPILYVRKTGGSGGVNHILPNIDCSIQRGAIKEVSSAKKSIDLSTIPKPTNEYLVKVNVHPLNRHGGASIGSYT